LEASPAILVVEVERKAEVGKVSHLIEVKISMQAFCPPF
jgi:hypothetical protein